jgi:hypothetical protein
MNIFRERHRRTAQDTGGSVDWDEVAVPEGEPLTEAEPAPEAPPEDHRLAQQIARALSGARAVLASSDEEFRSRPFLLQQLKCFGIPYNNWPEMDAFIDWKNPNDFGVMQLPTEFVDFLMFASLLDLRTAVEIGVWRGLSSYFAAAVLQRRRPDMVYTLLDSNDGLYGYEEFSQVLNLERVTPGGSADIYGQAFDLVLIDGDHSYDGAQADLLNVGLYAGKAIAFHDIHGHEFEHLNGGVVRLWKEFRTAQRDKLTILEFSHHPRPWMGIGLAVRPEAWPAGRVA